MYRVDNASNAGSLPAPSADGPNPGGYFEDKDPANGVEGTIVPAEWLNMVQEEIANVIEDADAGNTALDKSERTQLKNAILAMISAQGAGVPTGIIQPYAGAAAPTGYVLCYGQAISRVTYEDLYAIIGTTYGTGDGSTTFNVPDLRGRFPLGKDDMGGVAANRVTAAQGKTLGGSDGEEDVELTTDEIPSHTHQMGGSLGTEVGNDRYTITNGGSGGTSYTSTATGGGEAHNNMPPYLTLNYIIKT